MNQKHQTKTMSDLDTLEELPGAFVAKKSRLSSVRPEDSMTTEGSGDDVVRLMSILSYFVVNEVIKLYPPLLNCCIIAHMQCL